MAWPFICKSYVPSLVKIVHCISASGEEVKYRERLQMDRQEIRKELGFLVHVN